jgi:hypothetical protein
MRRRSVLATCGSCLAAIAGCAGDRESAAESTSTDSIESTPSHSNPRDAFRSAVKRNADHVETVSLDGKDWTVAYSSDTCCGDAFKAHQATLARNFSSVRPENVSLNVTTFHECMNIHWRISAQLAHKHRSREIDTKTYLSRVQNTTSRESQC